MVKRCTVPLSIILALALAGCSTPSGRGSRLLPWNWFAPDRATQVENAGQAVQQHEHTVIKAAQQDVRATNIALESAPPSRPVDTAREFARRADTKLGQALGPVDIAADNTLRALVGDLISENSELRAQAAAQMARRDAADANAARHLEASRAREAELQAKLIASDRRYQAEAETARKWKFWIFAIIGGWVSLQLIGAMARLYPGLQPIATLAGHVAAPAVQAAYNRVTTATGRAIADASRAGQNAAEVLRQHLDATTDEADQLAIRTRYESASRP